MATFTTPDAQQNPNDSAWVLSALGRNRPVQPPSTAEQAREHESVIEGIRGDNAAQATLLHDPLAAKYFKLPRSPLDLHEEDKRQAKHHALRMAQQQSKHTQHLSLIHI